VLVAGHQPSALEIELVAVDGDLGVMLLKTAGAGARSRFLFAHRRQTRETQLKRDRVTDCGTTRAFCQLLLEPFGPGLEPTQTVRWGSLLSSKCKQTQSLLQMASGSF
jgi:hypothetical protein